MNPFEQVHIDAAIEKQRKRDALKKRMKQSQPDYYSMSTREALIAKAERDVLARQTRRGFPSACYHKEKRVYVMNSVGDWIRTKEMVLVHDTEYIAKQIQYLVSSYGVPVMTKSEIYNVLETVSYRYRMADSIGLDKPPVVFKKRKPKKRVQQRVHNII